MSNHRAGPGDHRYVRVQHRHIIYVQGYDPRGLAQYYRMFRTELRKFGRLYQLSATIGRPQVAADGETASWTIETRTSDWQTRTSYDFLRWEDLIQRDLAAPIWHTVFHAIWIYWRLVFSGTIARFWKAHWRFATFATYPHFLLLIEALGALGIASGFGKGLQALGIPDLRIDRFAQYLAKVARESDAEEIVVVGHSSGSFLGAEILARALKLDPALGRHGPRVVLLTIGGNFPIVGFHAASRDFRDHLRLLAVEPSID